MGCYEWGAGFRRWIGNYLKDAHEPTSSKNQANELTSLMRGFVHLVYEINIDGAIGRLL